LLIEPFLIAAVDCVIAQSAKEMKSKQLKNVFRNLEND
jgi:hypothetical protein